MPGAPAGRWRRVGDVAIPLLFALFLASLVEEGSPGRPRWLTLAGLVVAVVSGGALRWRRSHPVPVMVVTALGSLVIQLIAPDGMFPFAALVALYALTAVRPPAVSLPATAALLAVTALNFRTAPPGDAAFALVFPLLVWAMGEATRNRTLAVRQGALRAMSEQHAALARELHDVVGHSVSVMVVQAAAADDVFDTHPDQARTALRAIEATGRDALAELRALLPAVRAGRVPVPQGRGLDRLDELVAPLVAAGLTVTVRRENAAGPPDAGEAAVPNRDVVKRDVVKPDVVKPDVAKRDVVVPVEVDRCAYRVVQESLTNTVRHAGARRAEVVVRRSAAELDVEVRDDGSARGDVVPGRGLTGMRERVDQVGGSFEAGPHPDGGFVVRARMPLGRPA